LISDDDILQELLENKSVSYNVEKADREVFLNRYSTCKKCEFLTDKIQCSLIDPCFKLVEQIAIKERSCVKGKW
jgi:hypothetical protein